MNVRLEERKQNPWLIGECSNFYTNEALELIFRYFADLFPNYISLHKIEYTFARLKISPLDINKSSLYKLELLDSLKIQQWIVLLLDLNLDTIEDTSKLPSG